MASRGADLVTSLCGPSPRLLTHCNTGGLATVIGGTALWTLKDVDFEVKNGVVRLTGEVPSGWYRLRAASCARGVKGVKSVQDDLRVEKPRG